MKPKKAIFYDFIAANKGRLIVQPRMGFCDFQQMRDGLNRVKQVDAPTVGTITIDSFTRTGDYESARRAIEGQQSLNGYPIVSYGQSVNERLVEGLLDRDFPIQVRHGSSQPEEIFRATIAAGIDATEGGPLSYCFPYGQVPLADSIASWRTCSKMLGAVEEVPCHLESFGGCMMGQLCPPSLLIAITVMEAMFFKQYGIRSYSVSLSQGSHRQQDIAALRALRRIAQRYLGPSDEWHIVYYTFMGKFPQTTEGARGIMRDSVQIAKAGGAQRLIVKTVMESHQIPTVDDNIEALNLAAYDFEQAVIENHSPLTAEFEEMIFEEANFLIDLLLNLDSRLDRALERAFAKGYWDVPYCLHPDNEGKVQAKLTPDGAIMWSNTGNIPFPRSIMKNNTIRESWLLSSELLMMLSFNQMKYDSLSTISTD